MMPFCEYHRCKKVAENKTELLRKWDSYDFRTASNHTQDIWLCSKHLKKINKLLGIQSKDTDNDTTK